ncbi:hypothetical protein, partial [Paenibacillus macerans]|uniref:hypothetical protein n=1 Tax=Paenibacillus macerans TaxID=44252 RepID=UPI003D318590
PSSADGTWTEGSWESRTPPSKEERALPFIRRCFFVCEEKTAKVQAFWGRGGIMSQNLQKRRYF